MVLICQLDNIMTRLQLFSFGTISPIDEKWNIMKINRIEKNRESITKMIAFLLRFARVVHKMCIISLWYILFVHLFYKN